MDLADALDADQLFLDYQPMRRASTTEQVVAVEALLRWQHPTRGVIEPDGFIPIAEASGLIVPIGSWVLGEACAQWRRGTRRAIRSSVSVNVSAASSSAPRSSTDVRAALAESGLDATALTLEISEATLARRPDARGGAARAAQEPSALRSRSTTSAPATPRSRYLRQFPSTPQDRPQLHQRPGELRARRTRLRTR